MKRTVYYPRIKSINFYDVDGVVCGGMSGSVAVKKFWRLVASFRFPKVSLANKVRVVL